MTRSDILPLIILLQATKYTRNLTLVMRLFSLVHRKNQTKITKNNDHWVKFSIEKLNSNVATALEFNTNFITVS